MAEIIVSKGKTSTGLELSYDSMFVLKGGKSVKTTLNEYGSMFVSSGGVASETTVNSGGRLFVSKGGKATKTTVNSSGSMVVSKGTVNSATVDHGDIYVYSGGKVNSAVFSGGSLIISSNCTANRIALESGASIYLYGSAKASNVQIKNGGMYVWSGAVVTNVTFEGGDADPAHYKYAGQLTVNGGTVKGLKIVAGTNVGLNGYCTATKVSWTPGDAVVSFNCSKISFTSKYSGVYVGSKARNVSQTNELSDETFADYKSAFVAKGGVMSDAVIHEHGDVYVWSGGTATQTRIEGYNAIMYVSSGGTVNSATILDHGRMYLSGGRVSNVTINGGGELQVYGGLLDGIKLETGGELNLGSCTATNVAWTPFSGDLGVGTDAHITFTEETKGVYVGSNGNTLLSRTDTETGRVLGNLSVLEEMYVMSGGRAENTTVGDNAVMYVFGGGEAYNTVIADSWGGLHVYEGGFASGITVQEGRVDVWGGEVQNVKLDSGCDLQIMKGGSASGVTVSSGASIYVNECVNLNDATVESGIYRQGGYIRVSSGAVLSNITLEYGARLFVSKGAKVTNVTSSYGSLIIAAKGATVKKIKAKEAVSPDSDHSDDTNKENGNGWKDKKKKTVTDAVLNSEALTFSKGMATGIVFDTNGPMSYDPSTYKNYVGYTDEIDFKKIHLDGKAMLNFQITATEAAKFTIWQWNDNKNKMVSLQSTALKERKDTGAKGPVSSLKEYYVETKGIVLDGGDYYLSVESTNAAKGGNAYYYVYLDSSDSKFFGTADNGDDKWKALPEQYDLGTLSGSKENIVEDWVGYEDTIDYRKFTVGEKTELSFEIISSEATKFTVWKYDARRKKTVALQTMPVDDYYIDWDIWEYRCKGTTDPLQLEAGEYYFSVESPNAKKSGNATYNVSVTVGTAEIKSAISKAALAMPETESVASALTMPEMDSLADSFSMTDSLSLGRYDADVLTGASASSLADLDDKTGWLNISMLA